MAKSDKTRARQKAWYEKNKERVIAKVIERQTANHDDYIAYQRRNRLENIDKRREQSRRWKAKNAERHRESSRRYSREHAAEISAKRKDQRRQLKQTVLNAYGGRCACCGESTYEFLTIDHADGDGANHRRLLQATRGRSHKVYKDIIERNFPPEYRVLCFNCNSALGFYGYCPHHPESKAGVPPTRRQR